MNTSLVANVPTKMVSEADIDMFVNALQAMQTAHYKMKLTAYTEAHGVPKVTAEWGSKYVRIVFNGSAFCFIERSTGYILKACSWRIPDKKYARGSIFAENCSLGETVGPYGTVYMKRGRKG